MSQRNLFILLAVVVISYTCHVRAEQNPYARYIASGFSLIDRWSLENVPDQELFNGAMNAMVDVLHKHGDEHSQFIDEAESDAFREEITQEFGGVGIRLRVLGDARLPTVISTPAPGTPAAQAEIRIGDRIVAVDGRSTAGLKIDAVNELIRGPVHKAVKLSLRRRGSDQVQDISVERAVITDESIYGDHRDKDGRWVYRLPGEPQLGYVRVTKFGDKTAAELERILAELTAGGLDGLIFDVRDNPGGALDAAVQICDLFLRAGQPIVTTRGRDPTTIRERFVSTGAGGFVDLPLVVLVDRNSASASEIVAACLQDYGRAGIVGERSYGKGTVQRLIRVESGRSLLKLTSATYWRPSGKNIHRMPGDDESAEWGVTPDVGLAVPLDARQYDAWRHYRFERDLISEGGDPELAAELTASLVKADGDIGSGYVDRALAAAVGALKARQKP